MNDYDDEQTPPQDLDAERGLLGGLLLSPAAIDDASEVLKGKEFYAPKHEQIYDAILDLTGRGEPVDAVTVANELAKRNELSRVGGPVYVHDLMQSATSSANVGYYAEIIKTKAQRRGIIRAGRRLVQAGYQTEDLDVDEVIEKAHGDLDAQGPDVEFDEDANGAALDELGEEFDNPISPGVMTGFKDLDELTNGLQPGDMTLIAARSAMGKSTLDLDIHRHVSLRLREHSLMFSLEMNRKLVIKRLLSAEGRISIQHLRYGGMTEQDWESYRKHYADIRTAPFHVVDEFGITLSQLIAKTRKLARKYPLKVMSVDYLQKLTTGKHRAGEREQEVGAMSSALKDLAGELNIHVIAVAQLNRGPEMRTDKTPQLGDLRESDRPVQDASLVIMPYRESYYDPESPRAGEADLFIRKNRHGPTPQITVAFQGHYSRFVDMQKS